MTPIHKIENHPASHRAVQLWIKRDDLLEPEIQGNKWRKLRPILEKLPTEKGILTFGGAFSNHLHAVAAAGKKFNRPTVGIVRGEAADLKNPTLKFCSDCGMRLFPISKKEFDAGLSSPAVEQILKKFPDFFVLPEGGATAEAVRGCSEISTEILTQVSDFQKDGGLFVAIPAGTGTTAAGVAAGLARGRVLIFPAARHGVSIEKIWDLQRLAGFEPTENFDFAPPSPFQKFAEMPPRLLDFVQFFQSETGILLDPIYTSKMLFQVWDLLGEGSFFPDGSAILALHTGGLQGWNGFSKQIFHRFQDSNPLTN